jgi:RecA/RadA recombinase
MLAMKSTDILRQQLMMKQPTPTTIPTDYLRTGSTLLDLACSGSIAGGLIKGRYFFFVGDSASGKTFLALTCLAEATKNHHFDNYRFVYDNAEDGALMDIGRFFGDAVAGRLEPPERAKDGTPWPSTTIEEFYFHLDDAWNTYRADERPFIYILDSMDSLSSQDEERKFRELKTASRKGKEDTVGSYGDGKAKKNSAGIRRIMPMLRESKSILIVISQTRDSLGFGFEPKTRAGGHALRFYATVELWSAVKEHIKKTVRDKPREVGVVCKVAVKKNRETGRQRTVEVPIYHSYGIDDIGSCIDYLIGEGHWKRVGNTVAAPELGFSGTRGGLIHHIEEAGLEQDLRDVVGDVWQEIEDACDLKRKSRY